jgi:hypothetical protein
VRAQAGAAAGTAHTSAALDRLAALDAVKTRMVDARDVLREAERWGALEADVGALLDAHKYEAAAARLAEAGASMGVFTNTPELAARRALLLSLQNQLEAALSAALVAAIEGRDADVCRAYYAIFANIQREAEFRTYYYGARRTAVVAMWQDAQLIDCDPTAPATQTLALFLPTFFNALLQMLQTERTSIESIFPDPQTTTSALLSSTMGALQPSFSQRLATSATHHGPKALPALIASLKATEEFAVGVDKLMQKIAVAATPAVEADEDGADAPPQRLARRQSSRKSVSRRSTHRQSISGAGFFALALATGAAEWELALLEPFLDFQADYAGLEARLLAALAADDVQPAPADPARALRERAVDVLGAVDDAIARCAAFTHGFGAAGLVRAVDGALAAFIDSSRALLAGSSKAPAAAQHADLSDLDYSADDWAAIQVGLHVLGAARALGERLTALEGGLAGALRSFAPALRDPTGTHIPGTPRGALALLAQSTLHSADLVALLAGADDAPTGPTFLAPAPRAGPAKTLVQARAALSEYARAAQGALHGTLLAPLRAHLAGYAGLAVWTEGAAGGGRVPTFSRSPSAPAQRAADGLLHLPRLFDAYAGDAALAFSLPTLPHVDAALLRALAADDEPAPPPPTPGHAHGRRAASISLRSPPVPAPAPAAEPVLSPEAVSSAWLCSLGRALVAHLCGALLPRIGALGPGGAAQLAADAGYLATVVQALNVAPAPLERWRVAAEMGEAALRSALAEGRAPEEEEVLRLVARMRGWAS